MDSLELYNWYFDEFKGCGCGQPDEVVKLVMDVLALIGDEEARGWGEKDRVKQRERFDEWKKKMDELLPTAPVYYFVLYQLDRCDLIEHGSGVPGWLTPKGKDLLAALQEHGTDINSWESS